MNRLLSVFAFFLLLACSQPQNAHFNSLEFIPENAEIILQSPELEKFLQSAEENKFLKQEPLFTKLKGQLEFLRFYQIAGRSLLSLSGLNKDKPEIVLASESIDYRISLDSIKNKQLETITQNSISFQKATLENSSFYLYQEGKLAVFSNRAASLISLISEKKHLANPDFDQVFETTDPKKTNVYIQNTAFPESFKSFLHKAGFPEVTPYWSWIAADIDLSPDKVSWNGLATPTRKSSIFGRDRGENITTEILPNQFNSYYNLDIAALQLTDSTSSELPVKNMALLKIANEEAMILSFLDKESASLFMAGSGEPISNYRNTDIFRLENPPLFPAELQELLHFQDKEFYSVLDQFVILTGEQANLKTLIAAQKDEQNFSKTGSYEVVFNNVASQSNQLFISRFQLEDEQNPAIAAVQFIAEENYAHFHAFMSSEEVSTSQNSGAQLTQTISLENPISGQPVFFKNHTSDQMDIAVQDNQNNLYLLSNRGSVFWNKALKTAIESPIYGVDLFRNGFQQLAFSTGYKFYVLDRNGKNVEHFPIEFNDAITQPLAVFDYDNNRKYRFVLVQNENVYMVGSNGKAIKGFDFSRGSTNIAKPPRHIRLGTKDYILISEASGKLHILNRQGSVRVPLKEALGATNQEWYGYNGKFVNLTTNNELLEITQNGNISKRDLALAENARLVANENTLVYLTENELHINDQVIQLDYGLYTNPQIAEVNGKSLVSICDTQAEKIYVFNTNGELLDGFPVFGTSQAAIANADTDPALELLCIGEENELLIYEFQ
ncbi:hypothetical protein [Christiangramia flava]|uniref:Uncharacterized protein n=1 Tax=Christiangramia flava JLT2011 TaxID=1229726 RepID=A0A1L7I255_9FLAO|nr:hypothetical protein [Christiangramia flava]APU67689.1 hypothetical protein GRFL_0965 [Christiangramia flava JLT2011]OSS40193.1 hypothetical protein C723_0501 [Christiangramia flava JLT2011]